VRSDSGWIPVFGNKARRVEDEKWACRGGCDAQVLTSHAEGPPNGICRCGNCRPMPSSQLYRDNYDKIFRSNG